MFKLEFSTENAAFEEIAGSSEVYRLLLVIAERVKKGDRDGIVIDLNGNIVGSWQLNNEQTKGEK